LGLEFFREIRRDRQNTPGILLIQKIGSFTQQTGTLEVENIKPLRDYFFYLTSFYVNANGHQKTIGTLKGGMDIKYGINDAFTLDAI
jgi:hypothetical protein